MAFIPVLSDLIGRLVILLKSKLGYRKTLFSLLCVHFGA